MESLPLEIIVNILRFVPNKDIISVLCVNSFFNDVGLRYLWKPHMPLKFIGEEGEEEPMMWGMFHGYGTGLLNACYQGYSNYYKNWSESAGSEWDPSCFDYAGFKNACKKGHQSIVDLMLTDDRIKNADVLEYMTAYEHDEASKALIDAGVTLELKNLENIKKIQSLFYSN